MIELYILIVLMIVGSVIALEIKDLLSSVILVGTVGICLSICFIMLKAPDLAMTQLIVEIMLVIILIRATISKDIRFTTGKREYGIFFVVFVGIFVFIKFADKVIDNLPIFGKPLLWVSQVYIAEAIKVNGIVNIVSKISLDYRLFDTFGAMMGLFAAVIGVLAIGRKKVDK